MFTIKHSLFFLIVVVPELFCYVFHVDYSYKYETNNTNGYTAMLLQKAQNGFWLIAGAPKFDTVTVCNPTCRGYSFSEKNPAGAELLGAVMDGGERADDPLYVCAPRHVTTPQYRANGRCFAWNDRFKSIQSLSNPLLQVQLYNSSYEFFYAHGQAGFSIKYIGGTEFLIGAPGVLSWKGTVIKHTTYDSKDILNVEKKFERHSYLGYSIEYDTFHFNSVKKRCVIAGAPRANDLGGMVVIFDYEYIHDFVLKTLYGDQISSYFGSSMLAAAPDLLIGAPMYTTKSYEEGCVFVYNNDNLDLVFLEKICGQHVGGRFGTAIAKIGGRYKAVAISAPYAEEDVGIIFIYFRHDYGYEKVQQISGKSVPGIVMGFGLSISRGLDIDENEENDIAVGSLYSPSLIVLRSRRILMLDHRLTSIFNKIAPGTKNLQFKYCFSYAQTATEEIDIVVSAESDDRAAIIEPNKPMKVAISSTVRCEDFALVLKSHAFDSPLPLKVKVTHKLNACPECPVLYHRSVSTVTHEIPFITGCGDDNVCEPDLKLIGRFANITELTMGTQDSVRLLVSLVNLGETAYLTQLNITLPVEISKFPVTCSKGQNVIHCKIPNRLTPNIIKEFDFHFDVKTLNPRIDKLEINVTVDSVGSGDGRSHFTTVTLPVVLKSNVTLIGFSPQEYLENKDGVNFTHEYMVFNSGPSPLLQEILEFDVPESILTSTGSLVNVFVISPLADECFPADAPPSKKARDVTKAKQAAVDIPEHVKYRFDCRNNSLVVCKKYRCLIGELAANASLKFRILVEVKTSLIYDVLGDKLEGKSLFLIQSVATFLDSFKRQKQIHVNTVLFRRMVEEVNIWMWVIIAVIGSILILTLLIIILFKLNFFARPMREKMKMEEENKNERECIMSNDIYAEDNSEVFSDIRF